MEGKMTTMRSPLGKARGFGSSKEGVGHWWSQRVSAVALIPLAVWFVVAAICLSGKSRSEMVEFFAAPGNAALMVSFLVAAFYHAQLGLQVVIEDYVHSEGCKLGLLIVTKLSFAFLGIFAVISTLKLAFGG
jgi:succinate dehydrogenase / fumarate reductase membrane anchor subunit